MRFHSVGAVVLLLAVGACALPTERIASPDHLATPSPRLAVADRPPADVAAHVASQDHVATSPPRLAAVHTPPVEMRELDSYAAVGNDATGSIAPAARTPDVPAPFRRVQKHVYLLLGGLQGKDGWVTSAGMFGLRSSLTALPDVTVTTYDWPSYKKVAADIALLPKDDVVIVIGYSGGGARATWLANLPSKPHIDLMIAYDPSPPWGMQVIGPNVKRALCYCNVTPAFFGLGGALLRGRDTNVEIVKIYEQHVLVQLNETLHQRTIEEVKAISKAGGPADFPRAAGSHIPG